MEVRGKWVIVLSKGCRGREGKVRGFGDREGRRKRSFKKLQRIIDLMREASLD